MDEKNVLAYLVSNEVDLETKLNLKLSNKYLAERIIMPDWNGPKYQDARQAPNYYTFRYTATKDIVYFKCEITNNQWKIFSFRYGAIIKYRMFELNESQYQVELKILKLIDKDFIEIAPPDMCYSSLWVTCRSKLRDFNLCPDKVKTIKPEKYHTSQVKKIMDKGSGPILIGYFEEYYNLVSEIKWCRNRIIKQNGCFNYFQCYI